MSAISPPVCRLCGKEHGTREPHQFAKPAKIIATYTPPAKKGLPAPAKRSKAKERKKARKGK